MLNARVLFVCLMRTYLIGASFNTRGLQNIGIVYAMEPGLKAIHKDPTARRDARKRYLRHFNTHPFWAPLLVGVFLSLEEGIARKTFPAELLASVKDTTVYTLSAIGDSVFGGSLLVWWSLLSCTLVINGQLIEAAILTGVLFVALQLFKLLTFVAGLREGLKVLQRLKKFDLINWGDRIKLCNGFLLALLMWVTWPGESHSLWWLLGVSALGLVAFMIGRFHISRLFLAACAVAGAYALPWAHDWLPIFAPF